MCRGERKEGGPKKKRGSEEKEKRRKLKISSYCLMFFSNKIPKLTLVGAAGVNALYFTFVEQKHILALPEGAPMPKATKILALASLVMWTLVLIAGRALPATSDGSG